MDPVAIVFVCTNEAEVLMPALDSLKRSAGRACEVVVVDNASTDDLAARIAGRHPDVRLLTRPARAGLPANLNLGIRSTSAPYVMLCNPDLIFLPGAVGMLADFLDDHPRAGMAAPRLLAPDGSTRPSARRWYTVASLVALKSSWARRKGSGFTAAEESLYADWDYSGPRPVDWVPCPATMVRRAALDQVGLMDERFRLYFDDVDISLRMHEGGWEVWCVPGAGVVHLENRSSKTILSRSWRWHLSSLLKFAWKHKGLRPRVRA